MRIDSLEMKWASDTDISQNQSNLNNLPYSSKLAQIETQVQNQSVRIDSLETKWASDTDISQNQSDSLKHLKSDIEQCGDRIAKLLTKYRTANLATLAKITSPKKSLIIINVCIHRRTVWKTGSYAKYVILLKYRDYYYYYYYY